MPVLNNLFSNAARHPPETTPIRVEAVRDGMHVAVSVSDEGRGIPADELPRLFRRRPGLKGGTGLGLAICKGLVEAHGGRIRAESGGPGLGARFTFTLPVAADTVDAAASGGRGRPRTGGSAFSWSTTIPGCCASSATLSARRASRRWRRATRTSLRAGSRPTGPISSCST